MSDRYGGMAAADRLLVDNHDPAINAVKVIHEVTSGVVSALHVESPNTTATAAALLVKGGADLIRAHSMDGTQQFKVDNAGSVTTGGLPGGYLCAPSVYAPVGQTVKSASTTTMAAFFSTSINTGAFTAPPSGNVLVAAYFMAGAAVGTFVAVGLAAHGTVTPIVGNEVQFETWTSDVVSWALQFQVTGLTPGTSYNFDLLGAASTGSFAINAIGTTSTTPTLGAGGVGGPVIMTVEATL